MALTRPDPVNADDSRGSAKGIAGSIPVNRPSYDARSVPRSMPIETSASDSVPLNISARASRPPPVSASVARSVPVPCT